MTNVSDRLLLDTALGCDLVTFIHRTVQTVAAGHPYLHNWHVEAMAWQLSRVLDGSVQRLIITLPPRHLKSICASVAFPAFALGRDPTRKIICVSYADQLASKHAQDCRAVMQAAWYKRRYPGTRISREKNRELDFMTTARGGRYATSIGGALTGRGGDIIVVDDPLKSSDAMSKAMRSLTNGTFDRAVYSRLDDKRHGAIIVVSQRLHSEDLVGHLLAKGEKWEHLCLPAIAETDQDIPIGPGRVYRRPTGEVLHEAHESRAVIDGMRVSLGSYTFSAQYQQCPVSADGGMIKWSWFLVYDEVPVREYDDAIVQSWDTAYKASQLAITRRARPGLYGGVSISCWTSYERSLCFRTCVGASSSTPTRSARKPC